MTNDAQAWITRHLSRPSFDEPTRRTIAAELLNDGDVTDCGRIVKIGRNGLVWCEGSGRHAILQAQVAAAAYYGWETTGISGMTQRGPVVVVQRP